MYKDNTIAFPVMQEIAYRKSIRAFSDEELTTTEVSSLFEAARWSFSSSNEQAWNYVYGLKGDPIWQLLFASLMDGNKKWCVQAPMLVLSLAKKTTSRGTDYKHNFHDVGASTMAMALQAVSMGIQVHPMGGFIKEQVITSLYIPGHLEPVTMLAIGKAGNNLSLLSEKQQQAEQERSERFIQAEFVRNTPF